MKENKNDGIFVRIFKVVTGNVVKWWRFIISPIRRIDNNSAGTQGMETQMQIEGMQGVQGVTMSAEQNGTTASMQADQTPKAMSKEESDAQAVLDRIKREEEEKRKKDMEKAQEEARLAAILNSTKVDVSAFIQAGKDAMNKENEEKEKQEKEKQEKEKSKEKDSPSDDVLARAEEIMARLNREAAEDEAKKSAQIEEAKKQAAEKFGK